MTKHTRNSAILNEERVESACPNCGHALSGRYCSECGQEQGELFPTPGAWLGDALAESFALEGRILSSLRLLAWRPGDLTLSWVRGQRARHVGPLRFYLVAALVFFLTMSLTPLSGVVYVLLASNWSNGPRGPTREQFVDSMRFLDGSLPILLITLLVPLFAALLMVANRLRRPFVIHMVAALHFHTFAFLFVALTALLHIPFGGEIWSIQGSLWMLAALWVFLIVSVKRVYDVSWLGAVVRTSVACVVYSIAVVYALVQTLRVAP